MKICLGLPLLANAQDDTSTLLSLKVHTALEAGVDHLLDAVGSRNVTQMSSLLQNLVEESISDGLGEVDQDVKTALQMIKAELLGDIRSSLKEAHCYSQVHVHEQVLCFEDCDIKKKEGYEACGTKCDGSEHKVCREELFGLYKAHITACRALDHFVVEAEKGGLCDPYDPYCCYLPHSTWNCEIGMCKDSIKKLQVDNKVGDWLQRTLNHFKTKHKEWEILHEKCSNSYRAYIDKDADCDCKQAECEARNCEYDLCHFTVCEHNYQNCWRGCEASVCMEYPKEQCLEKDRKIDWSATEKIECYVDVLLKKPTREELLENCGSETCINQFRENMYKDCNNLCPEVDTTGKPVDDFTKAVDVVAATECSAKGDYIGNDHNCIDSITALINKMTDEKRRNSDPKYTDVGSSDVTQEGEEGFVTTRHRGEGDDKRCTAHLDIDWQAPPCCSPCEERDSAPCESEGGAYTDGWSTDYYMGQYYGQYGFLSTDAIKGFMEDTCWADVGEHTYEYAYNLCPCKECPEPPTPPCPTCVDGPKSCAAQNKASYDYSVHYPARKHDCTATGSFDTRGSIDAMARAQKPDHDAWAQGADHPGGEVEEE